jgi:N-acetylglucosamine-6-sulfatase
MRVGALVVCLAVAFLAASGEFAAQSAEVRPNILFILTDDQDAASLEGMDKVHSRLVANGTTFERTYVTIPQCCPSRASILRGQYAHNHDIWNNFLPDGGYEKFRDSGLESSTFATWLKRSGYATGYVGKYLNGYGQDEPELAKPPGWNWWIGWQGAYNEFGPREYRVNENGVIRSYRRDILHDTDYIKRKAEAYIRRDRSRPWLLMVATNAPHDPFYYAKRHEGMYAGATVPHGEAFNEEDISDKPAYVQKRAPLTGEDKALLEERWQERIRGLESVDDLVGRLTTLLKETGQLQNTYIVFTSDNGYLLGEHRLIAKGYPYEEAIRIPLVIRGPGVPRGDVREQLVSLNDLAPTFARWGGASTPEFVDGRSLEPLLLENPTWERERLLVEFRHHNPFSAVLGSGGVRYVEYESGERELYDLDTDPHQLQNVYGRASPGERAALSSQLDALRTCAGQECTNAEN